MACDYATAELMGFTTRLRRGLDRGLQTGLVTAAEAAAWRNHLAEAERTGRLFSSLTFFLISGRKP